MVPTSGYHPGMTEPFDPGTLAFYAREAVDYAARRPLAGDHQLQPFWRACQPARASSSWVPAQDGTPNA